MKSMKVKELREKHGLKVASISKESSDIKKLFKKESLKIGDRVNVRKDLKVGEEYGCRVFSSWMKEKLGSEVTIQETFGNGLYHIEEFNGMWTDEMFE